MTWNDQKVEILETEGRAKTAPFFYLRKEIFSLAGARGSQRENISSSSYF